MAEVKNTFIQSKMNQDLDGRVLPNGQYRYGKNIQISRSEGDDVGALENILGNELLTTFGLTDSAYEIIGHTVDVTNDVVYVFITDYSDSSANQLENNITGQNAAFGYENKNCFIGVFNDRTKGSYFLAGGDFLNFSKTHPITGINLVEELLFWTDNRNQPRKINIKTAAGNPFVLGGNPGYYTNEDTISVAKYYPFECISLLKPNDPTNPTDFDSTMTNKTEEWLPPYCVGAVDVSIASSSSVILNGAYNVKVGDKLSGVNIDQTTTPTVSIIQYNTPILDKTTIHFSGTPQTLTGGASADLIYFSSPNPDLDPSWPGDETFLSDKFVRFSYRFEFDDGEYSLMAPFTQACFVPKQDGYFIGSDVENLTPLMNTTDAVPAPDPADPDLEAAVVWDVSSTLIGDEGRAYASSIVEFFENKVQDVGLYIPAPYINDIQSTFDNIQDEFKIKNIEIIYKESDSTVAYVLDTIEAPFNKSDGTPETTSFYSYDYQSRKPWKTLPEREITRVYDKVPIRALAQESSGNRIIYGNYIDKHTSPNSLAYVVGIDAKPVLPINTTDVGYGDRSFYVRKEYQNHTVKQNRTYQVGVVLSDRYGRQSDVILSDIFNTTIEGYGSTIYHPYKSTQSSLITNTPVPDTWPGDQINMIWHQVIPENPIANGYPGVYKNNDETLVGLEFLSDWTGIDNNAVAPDTCCINFTATQYLPVLATAEITICADSTGKAIPESLQINSSTGEWNEGSTVSITSDGIWPDCSDAQIGTYNLQSKTLIKQNTLGWYSWKIVVKQTEQDYYNCYLPGMLAGYPKDIRKQVFGTEMDTDTQFPKGDESKVGHIVLINDNINKIPRDLSEVGPTQKMFGSSVKLYGRVENYKTPSDYYTYNRQFDPETLPDTAINIGNLTDLNLGSMTLAGDENINQAPFSYPTPWSKLIPINFYNGITNPLVARVSTKKEIGWGANDSGGQDQLLGMIPYLSVYETSPVVSNLDIYWETSTSGLISELNHNILTEDNTVPCDITEPSIDWSEGDAPGTIISDKFKAISCAGVELDNYAQNTTVQLISVKNGLGDEKVQEFELIQTAGYNEYEVRIGTTQWEGYFLAWRRNARREWTFTFQIDRPATTLTPVYSAQVTRTVQVQNNTPNQIGMFEAGGGSGGVNNARTDIKNTVYNQEGYFAGTFPTTRVTPIASVVGDWQDTSSYFNSPDNRFWQTFGILYDGQTTIWNADTTGYGKYNVGNISAYNPTFNIGGAQGWAGAAFTNQGSTINISKYINRKIRMIHNPYGTNEWDGLFEAFNGSYGTIFGSPAPTNPNRGQELYFEVARAYQVSAFFTMPAETHYVPNSGNIIYTQWVVGEAVFNNGADPVPGSTHANAPVISLLPKYGDSSVPDLTWVGWTAVNGASSSTTNDVPTGPIYFNYKHGNINDPADFNTGGENTVLQLYDIGNSHYWKDLSDVTGANPGMLRIQTPGPGVREMPNSPNQKGFWVVNKVDIGQIGATRQLGLNLIQAQDVHGRTPEFRMSQSSPPGAYDPQGAYLMTDKYVPMPPGRYVVTVRATDRSVNGPSGDGLYFEWDIPVIINGPFVQNNGSWMDPSFGNNMYNPFMVKPYPWR